MWAFPLLGFVIGNFSGLLGLGGGWLLTPIFNILGFSPASAVGTTLTQMIGSSGAGALKHWRMKNLAPSLALTIVMPLIIGVLCGKQAMVSLAAHQIDGDVLRFLHISLGTFMSFFILKEVFGKSSNNVDDEHPPAERIHIPYFGPTIQVNENARIPIYAIIAIAGAAGFVSALMGIGGGLILIPTMIYIFGVKTITAVATNLACILAGSTVGAFSYALDGNVNWTVALLVLIGSMSGSYVGASVSIYVPQRKLRMFFGLLLIASTSGIGLKQLGMDGIAQIVIFGGAISLWSAVMIPALLMWYRKRPANNEVQSEN